MLSLLKSIDIEEICIETAKDSEEAMKDAMEDQLAHGLRADGKEITPPYTEFTIMLKEQKTGLSAVTDVVTLFDTGAHYSKLFARVKDTIIEFGSEDEKSKELQKKYTKEIYGLNEESREAVIEDYMEPRYQAIVVRETGLEFK